MLHINDITLRCVSLKKYDGIGMGSSLNKYKNFGNIDIFMALILPSHDKKREDYCFIKPVVCFSNGK